MAFVLLVGCPHCDSGVNAGSGKRMGNRQENPDDSALVQEMSKHERLETFRPWV